MNKLKRGPIPSLAPRTAAKGLAPSVQSEYVRNLQQQIYLLELETRYLKTGAKKQQPNVSLNPLRETSVKLPESMNSSTGDEETTNEYIATISKLNGKLEKAQEEIECLTSDLQDSRQKSSDIKEKTYGELLAFKQRFETSQDELHQSNQSYKRVLQESELVQSRNLVLEQDNLDLSSKIGEQIQINFHLKTRNASLQSKITEIEVKVRLTQAIVLELREKLDAAGTETYTAIIKKLQIENGDLEGRLCVYGVDREASLSVRKQLEINCVNAVREQAVLKQQLQHAEFELAHEKTKSNSRPNTLNPPPSSIENSDSVVLLRDEIKMMGISCENLQQQIIAINHKSKNREMDFLKNLEAKAVLQEQANLLRDRATVLALENSEIGQDKRLLQDDLAETQNTLESIQVKHQGLSELHEECKHDLSRLKNEQRKWANFGSVLDKVESNGLSYMQMMKEMRVQMSA